MGIVMIGNVIGNMFWDMIKAHALHPFASAMLKKLTDHSPA